MPTEIVTVRGYGEDPTVSVSFIEERTPLVVVLHFKSVGGFGRWRNVGFELRQDALHGPARGASNSTESTFDIDDLPDAADLPAIPPTASEDSGEPEPRPVEVDPAVLERIALEYDRYLRAARMVIEFDQPWPTKHEEQALAAQMARLRLRGRGRKGHDAEFLQRLAAEVRERQERGERSIGAALARAHHVDRSTASRWLKRLRAEGYLP